MGYSTYEEVHFCLSPVQAVGCSAYEEVHVCPSSAQAVGYSAYEEVVVKFSMWPERLVQTGLAATKLSSQNFYASEQSMLGITVAQLLLRCSCCCAGVAVVSCALCLCCAVGAVSTVAL